jgi:hypothetical protein
MLTTILVGLPVALILAEITGVLPGGIIVPAYLALFVEQPARIARPSLRLSPPSACIGRRPGIPSFRRRRFVFLLLAGALIGQVWLILWPRLLPLRRICGSSAGSFPAFWQ